MQSGRAPRDLDHFLLGPATIYLERTAPRAEESHALRELRRERDRLQSELNRKDKALAEAAALLVLQKKFQDVLSGGES